MHRVAKPLKEGVEVTRPDINHVGVRRCHLDGADGRNAPDGIEDRIPRCSRARRLPDAAVRGADVERSEEHTSELQSQSNLVCRLLLEKKKKTFIHSSSMNPAITASRAPHHIY